MKQHIAENCHWYAEGGVPVLEVPKADGKGLKKPTLREARIAGCWVPGATGINGIEANHGITEYMLGQSLMVVATSPTMGMYYRGEIDEEEMRRRVRGEINEHKDTAAAGGKRLHALDEFFVEHGHHAPGSTENERAIVDAIEAKILEAFGPQEWRVEEAFANLEPEFFYGGRIDRRTADHRIYADLKTQEWDEGKKPNFYSQFPQQLAAYANGARVPGDPPLSEQRLVSVVAHRCRPEVHIKEYTTAEVEHAFERFDALRRFFLISKKLGPWADNQRKAA